MKPPYAIGSVPSLSGHAIAYRWRSLPRVRRHRASKPQGSSERVLPWQITMNQLIFASLSHTHYWYEVGMLKVPCQCSKIIGYSSCFPYEHILLIICDLDVFCLAGFKEKLNSNAWYIRHVHCTTILGVGNEMRARTGPWRHLKRKR